MIDQEIIKTIALVVLAISFLFAITKGIDGALIGFLGLIIGFLIKEKVA